MKEQKTSATPKFPNHDEIYLSKIILKQQEYGDGCSIFPIHTWHYFLLAIFGTLLLLCGSWTNTRNSSFYSIICPPAHLLDRWLLLLAVRHLYCLCDLCVVCAKISSVSPSPGTAFSWYVAILGTTLTGVWGWREFDYIWDITLFVIWMFTSG